MDKIIAIIPARSGSKRIPNKNIHLLHGKPMIAWTIEAAIESGCFDDVYVNTDSKKIADISKSYGAQVPFLRTAHADDYSTVSEATISFLEKLNDHGVGVDIVCQLMANCPLRTSSSIIDFVDHFRSSGITELISCVKPKFGNPQWVIECTDLNNANFLEKNNQNTRSQDLSELVYPTGAIWISTFKKLLNDGSFYSQNFAIKKLSWIEAIDIDEIGELAIAEKLFAYHD